MKNKNILSPVSDVDVEESYFFNAELETWDQQLLMFFSLIAGTHFPKTKKSNSCPECTCKGVNLKGL